MDRTEFTRKISELSVAGKKQWMDTLKSEFKKSPLATNVVLGTILAGLEKLVELEFACPCNSTWNALFASAFFIIPGFTASLLMLLVHGFKPDTCQKFIKLVLLGLVPSIIWVILMFLDGRYYACAMTNWSGRFVIIDKAAPEKWCEPANDTSSQQLMIKTQEWFFRSQAIGLGILLTFVVAFGPIYKLLKPKAQEQEHKVQEKEPASERLTTEERV